MTTFDEIWEEGLISFDTSSLGRMYEWEVKDAVNIKDAVSYLFQGGKLWETEVTIHEFSRQRVEIKESIYETKFEKGIFNNLKKRPIPWIKIDGTLGRWEAKGFSEKFRSELAVIRGKKQITTEEFDRLVTLAKQESRKIELEHLFDAILKKDDISLTDAEKRALQRKYDSGALCPGAKDSQKNNGNQYNDLYTWELLKKKAKQEEKGIIFVTCDCKEDWYENGSPRPEYRKEFVAETGQEIIILTLSEFWENCKDYLEVSVEDFIELSSIREQIAEKYDDCYEEDICDKIEALLMESDEIKEELENAVDCCVDMAVLDELVETTLEDIEVTEYDEEEVFVNVYLQTEAGFEAMNHTGGEDWNAGSATVLLEITALARIPVTWKSEDTKRIVLEDSICVEEITEITVVEKKSV